MLAAEWLPQERVAPARGWADPPTLLRLGRWLGQEWLRYCSLSPGYSAVGIFQSLCADTCRYRPPLAPTSALDSFPGITECLPNLSSLGSGSFRSLDFTTRRRLCREARKFCQSAQVSAASRDIVGPIRARIRVRFAEAAPQARSAARAMITHTDSARADADHDPRPFVHSCTAVPSRCLSNHRSGRGSTPGQRAGSQQKLGRTAAWWWGRYTRLTHNRTRS